MAANFSIFKCQIQPVVEKERLGLALPLIPYTFGVIFFQVNQKYVHVNGTLFERCVAGAAGAWFILTTTPTQQHRKVKHDRSCMIQHAPDNSTASTPQEDVSLLLQ